MSLQHERVAAALQGSVVDRPPVAAWRHFLPEEQQIEALANIHVQFTREYDWDWIKVNPRATYYAEAWGNTYDYQHYDGVLPRLISGPITQPDDLTKLKPVSGTAGVFGEHLELLRQIKAAIDVPFVQTVFSPISVLAFLTTQPGDQTPELGAGSQFKHLRRLLHEHPAEVHAALGAISQSLREYASATLEAGAAGLFFAIVRLAREDALSKAEYEEFGVSYDLQVLEGVKDGWFNLLHVCGPHAYLELANRYPVHAVNWAAVGQGNPTLAEERSLTDRALIGGIDEHGALQHGTPEQVQQEARAAIKSAGAAGLLLSPGCGVAINVPEANLHALRGAV